jgi:hypothetical protein
VLGVDDPLEQRRHQVDELDVGRDREQRDLEAVGLREHLRRDLAEVGQGPHHQSRASFVGDPADQSDLGVDVVFDGKAAGEHEVAGTRLDLGSLHQAHPFHLPVEAFRTRHELGRGEHRAHDFAHRGAGLAGLRFDSPGSHHGQA